MRTGAPVVAAVEQESCVADLEYVDLGQVLVRRSLGPNRVHDRTGADVDHVLLFADRGQGVDERQLAWDLPRRKRPITSPSRRFHLLAGTTIRSRPSAISTVSRARRRRCGRHAIAPSRRTRRGRRAPLARSSSRSTSARAVQVDDDPVAVRERLGHVVAVRASALTPRGTGARAGRDRLEARRRDGGPPLVGVAPAGLGVLGEAESPQPRARPFWTLRLDERGTRGSASSRRREPSGDGTTTRRRGGGRHGLVRAARGGGRGRAGRAVSTDAPRAARCAGGSPRAIEVWSASERGPD